MDTKNKAERWRQADDDPAFIYALDASAGVNIFDLKISGGYHNGKRTSPEEIAEIAALIVTAPELLAVCEAIANNNGGPIDGIVGDRLTGKPEPWVKDSSMMVRREDFDALCAAIAKAKPNADAKLID